MQGKHPFTPATPSWPGPVMDLAGPASADPLKVVEEAAALNTPSDFEHEHSAPELQAAVAAAVLHGAPIKDVAAAAHMTALEVLDAADAFSTGCGIPSRTRPGSTPRFAPERF